MGTIKTKTCIRCWEFFETVDGRKRMCPACEAKAKEERQNKAAKKAMTNLAALEAKNPEVPKKNETLDAKLADLHAQGKTYAEAQKEETLRMIGGVNVEVGQDLKGYDADYYDANYISQVNVELNETLRQAERDAAEKAWAFAKAIIKELKYEEVQALFDLNFVFAVEAVKDKKEHIDKIMEVL